MTLFGGTLGFAAPLLLWALLALPVLWLLLRVIPPAPILRRFPGIVLLIGLEDRESAAARTPLLLMILRVAAVGLAILGFAGPILNPDQRETGQGPLLLLADAGWGDATDWPARRDRLRQALEEAVRAGRTVAFANLSDPAGDPPVFTGGEGLADRLAALLPAAWEPPSARLQGLAKALPEGGFETLWLTDGLDRAGRADLLAALMARGPVTVALGARPVLALGRPLVEEGKVKLPVLNPRGTGRNGIEVIAMGLDPTGVEREVARQTVDLAPGARAQEVTFDLPAELRNRVTRLQIAGEASAGAVALADDGLKRRKVALIASAAPQEGLELLSPLHYLRQALARGADLVEGGVADVLPAAPDVVILADVAHLPAEDADALADWVDEGGLLVRFAGPRLAAAIGVDGMTDPLLPVTLRPGGRAVGGTMSWGAPRAIAPFPEGSPFHGLAVPSEVTVSTQVLAEPAPDLAARTIAALDDGTPLVTRADLGGGQVVLFHVSASADWSGLPISGLFVSMLDRLAVSSRAARPAAADLAGTVWVARRVMDAYGLLTPATAVAGIEGARIAGGQVGPDMPPGLYDSQDRTMAVNVVAPGRVLEQAVWPAAVRVEGIVTAAARPLKGWVLGLAALLLMADVLATLALSGRLARSARAAVPALLAGLLLVLPAPVARADEAPPPDAERLIIAAGGMVLGHVLTGDARLDRMAGEGLAGLSMVLTQRTSVEPGAPMGVDLEKDDLSVFTFLYWPISVDQPAPSIAAYRKLNQFLKSGGMILFDTRDADMATGGSLTPEGRRLQEIAALLDVPPLEPLPADHVLTRSFYLLQDFPGRYTSRAVWVEAAPPDAEQAEGVPFRNLNDGVSPVVIGANDWAAAWAVDPQGAPLYPVGRGLAGDRQREIAYRFGINLVMYVLTGNYKSDQVHVPALLERLGQ